MILITGGAGYIGSHVVKQLLKYEQDLLVIDNFSTGFSSTIETLQKIRSFNFIELDLKDFEKLSEIFTEYNIDTVMHFAAFSQVHESIQNPTRYYMNNTVNSTNLIKTASQYGVKNFIFSSTAAVYGEPNILDADDNITEETKTEPINPYGHSKLMIEKVLIDESRVNKNLNFCILRYFNVAGADLENDTPIIGESHNPETHLVPLVAKTALGKGNNFTIFGDDYATLDGTCIRDYIHVDDLASAHIAALEYLNKNKSNIFNCGYGHGFSVKEVVEMIKKISGNDFEVKIINRREGDPARLVANNKKILQLMKWKPQYDNLELICKSALTWEKLNNNS